MISTYYTVLYDEIYVINISHVFHGGEERDFLRHHMCSLVGGHQHSVFITWVGRLGGEEGKSVPPKYR